jgi:hypothetical protein
LRQAGRVDRARIAEIAAELDQADPFGSADDLPIGADSVN